MRLLTLALLAGCGAEAVAPAATINEIVALNRGGLEDEHGELEDWLELYNPGPEPVELAGYTLVDELGAGEPWSFPSGARIDPDGFLVVFCDGSPDQGDLHASFTLDVDGESVLLFDADGMLVEETRWAILEPDTSWARVPDGGDVWQTPDAPTPGASNE